MKTKLTIKYTLFALAVPFAILGAVALFVAVAVSGGWVIAHHQLKKVA